MDVEAAISQSQIATGYIETCELSAGLEFEPQDLHAPSSADAGEAEFATPWRYSARDGRAGRSASAARGEFIVEL